MFLCSIAMSGELVIQRQRVQMKLFGIIMVIAM